MTDVERTLLKLLAFAHDRMDRKGYPTPGYNPQRLTWEEWKQRHE